jgi:predicted AlkP superfamily pyrophosphatase or phosphodiesterase
MTTKKYALLFLLVLWATPALAFDAKTPAADRDAILISWDGALREHVRADLAAGKLPNLARLAKGGSFVDIEVTGHITDTKAGHSELLSGYGPDRTGVRSDSDFAPIPAGLSVFERLRKTFPSLTTIMLTGKDHNLGSRAPGFLTAGEPFFHSRAGISVWDGDKMRPAREVGERAVRYVHDFAKKGRFFLFIHFADVDLAGHRDGEGSPSYDQALEECDRWLGKILDELSNQGIEGRTLVYVSADHGFDVGAKTHQNAPHISLASSDPRIVGPGQQRDIAPTVLQALGVDLATVQPSLPGKSLSR